MLSIAALKWRNQKTCLLWQGLPMDIIKHEYISKLFLPRVPNIWLVSCLYIWSQSVWILAIVVLRVTGKHDPFPFATVASAIIHVYENQSFVFPYFSGPDVCCNFWKFCPNPTGFLFKMKSMWEPLLRSTPQSASPCWGLLSGCHQTGSHDKSQQQRPKGFGCSQPQKMRVEPTNCSASMGNRYPSKSRGLTFQAKRGIHMSNLESGCGI